ncbi:hypothetical protein GCM10027277_29100 [Pseudoduganella ginsengisoli]|nr:DUF2917 domain-containing protein [Pseudoduganella ginsengisoli]
MQFTLQAGESAALAQAGTVRVRCHAGFLWITGFRNGEDVVLGAGDSAVLPPTERHYFSALGRVPHAAFDLQREDVEYGRITALGAITSQYRHLLRRLRHLLQ